MQFVSIYSILLVPVFKYAKWRKEGSIKIVLRDWPLNNFYKHLLFIVFPFLGSSILKKNCCKRFPFEQFVLSSKKIIIILDELLRFVWPTLLYFLIEIIPKYMVVSMHFKNIESWPFIGCIDSIFWRFKCGNWWK